MVTEGSARIMCKFVLERDIESAAQDVREKVAGSLRSLPPTSFPRSSRKRIPIPIRLSRLWSPVTGIFGRPPEIADQRNPAGARNGRWSWRSQHDQAHASGESIYADAEKLDGITISQLQRAIQSENVEVPGGRIIRGESEMGVRTLGRLDAIGQFGDIIVANVNGAPVRMSGVGRRRER